MKKFLLVFLIIVSLYIILGLLSGCADPERTSPKGTYIDVETIVTPEGKPDTKIIIYSDSTSHSEVTYIFVDGQLTKKDTMRFQ